VNPLARILVSGLFALQFAAAQKAVVKAESMPVYAAMDLGSAVIAKLPKGTVVAVDLIMLGNSIRWCSITAGAQQEIAGYVNCAYLERGAAPQQRPSFKQGAPAATIEELLRLSGIEVMLARAADPATLAKALRDAGGKESPEMDQLVSVLQAAMRPERFLSAVREKLRQDYSQERMDEVLNFCRSDLARRINSAEVDAVGAEGAQRFRQYLDKMQGQAPPPERLALVRRLDSVTDTWDLQMEIATSVLRAVAEVQNPKLPAGQRLTEEKLGQITAGLRGMQPALKSLTYARMLHVYASVPTGELEQYVRFWETPSGRWYRNVLYQGMVEATREAMREMIKGIAAVAPEKAP